LGRLSRRPCEHRCGPTSLGSALQRWSADLGSVALTIVTRQRLAHLRRPETYRQAAIDVIWSLTPRRAAEAPLSWTLAPIDLERVEIRWPTVYEDAIHARFEPILRDNFRQLVTVVPVTLPQPYPGITMFQFTYDGHVHDIVLDLWDDVSVNAEAERRCSVYFKLQHLAEGYGSEKVVPGGFIQHRARLEQFLPRLRRIRAAQDFRYDAYGRFGLQFATDIRSAGVRLLSEQDAFAYEGGMRKVRFGEALREVARSKVCVDLPGNGPFCYRLIDYLAIGSCVIAARHDTVLHVPLVDRRDIVYAQPDLSDLVELCDYYVHHDAEREEIARHSREFYDRHLAWRQLAAYYLHTCLTRLK
jgi:Glycosyl transferases group 1